MYFSLLSSQPFYDLAEPVALWLTVGIIGALLIAGLAMFFAKREYFARFAKYALIAFFFYAVALGLTMLIANLIKRTDKEYMLENYLDGEVVTLVLIPLIVAFGVMLICGLTLFALSLKGIDAKIYKLICFALAGAGIAAAAVTVGVYFGRHIKGGGYYDGGYGEVNQLALYLFAAGLLALSIAAAFITGRKDRAPFDSRCIALAGICIALSFALSYVRLFRLPQGGSITLASLLPVMLFAYVYGPKKGLLIGIVYGMLQAVQDPYIIHPAQFFLDYPIAFAMVAFAGTFKNVEALDRAPQIKFICGALIAGILRFVCHVIAGVFAFSAYAVDNGMGSWAYSLAYNSFVFADLVLVIVVGALVFSSKAFVRATERFTGGYKKSAEKHELPADGKENT